MIGCLPHIHSHAKLHPLDPNTMAWQFDVTVRTAALGADSQPSTSTYSSAVLQHFSFFSNMPAQHDGQPMVVDLVLQGMSPWPVETGALAVLDTLLQPFNPLLKQIIMQPRLLPGRQSACSHQQAVSKAMARGLSDTMDEAGTTMTMVLECADALGLSSAMLRDLDDLVLCWLQEDAGLFVQEDDNDQRYPCLHEEWAVGSGDLQFLGDADGSPEALIPVARWAALQLYGQLDRLGLQRCLEWLSGFMVNAGLQLLYGDKHWQEQLLEAVSMPGQGGTRAVVAQALSAVGTVHACEAAARRLPWTLKEVVTGPGVELQPGVLMEYAKNAYVAVSVTYNVQAYEAFMLQHDHHL